MIRPRDVLRQLPALACLAVAVVTVGAILIMLAPPVCH